jgi:hypothetical protein
MKKIVQSTGQGDGRSQGSNSDKGELFLSLLKCLDSVWGPHYLLGITYCSSLGINRPGREPNNSPVTSAQVTMLSTKVPLVLRFQLNEQQ